jgi:type IV pilus assembly protein PilN
MTRINLLPWREEYREEKKKEFIAQFAVVSLIALALAYIWFQIMAGAVDNQKQRNAILQTEINRLEQQVKEIQELKKRRAELVERMKVIQDLQGTRPIIVRYFDELVRAVPDGIYLTALTRTGDVITIEGVTESNNRVSSFMRQLDDSEWFADPNLKAVTADPKLGEQASRFSMLIKTVLPAGQQQEEGV